MTITESAPTTRGNGRKNQDNDAAPLTDQVVLSGAGLASQGIGTARRIIDGSIATVDTLVLGGFDIADQLVGSNVLTDIASKSISAARQAWTTGIDAARTTVRDV